jgi:hypothetical protein
MASTLPIFLLCAQNKIYKTRSLASLAYSLNCGSGVDIVEDLLRGIDCGDQNQVNGRLMIVEKLVRKDEFCEGGVEGLPYDLIVGILEDDVCTFNTTLLVKICRALIRNIGLSC